MLKLRSAIVAFLIIGGASMFPLLASAHALLQTSNPAVGATLQQSPSSITITFGERPDPKLSSMQVLNTVGQHYEIGRANSAPNNSLVLTIAVHNLPKGIYTVNWRTVSAVDGHTAAGSYAFGVQITPSTNAVVNSDGGVDINALPGVLTTIGRFVFYIGLILLLGAAFNSLVAFAFSEVPSSTIKLLFDAALTTAVGVVLVVAGQLHDAGLGLDQLQGSSLGKTAIYRAIPSLIILICTSFFLFYKQIKWLRWGIALIAVITLASMLIDVINSHATAQGYPLVNGLLQWLHIVSAGIWIGGLAALLLSLRSTVGQNRSRAVRRFSTAAGFCLFILTITGVIRALVEINSWDKLFTTTFGTIVVVKFCLVIILGILGAVNRYVNIRGGAERFTSLRKVGSTELGVALVAILLAAGLVNVAPPISAAGSQAPSTALTLNTADDATTIKAQLEISPGEAGFNAFNFSVKDYDSRAPITKASVELHFAFTGSTSIGESTLLLKNSGGGSFIGDGANLSLAGTWNITALVQRGANSTEVTFKATIKSPPTPPGPKIDISKNVGLPTLYTIHVSENRAVQVYFDPDKSGIGDFHVTFFDAQGNELPVNKVTVELTLPGGTAMLISDVQKLEPGHFSASVTLPSGPSHFAINGTNSNGENISTAITLTPGS